MVSISNEVVAILGGAAVSIPYVYQFNSPKSQASDLSPAIWIGWVLGLFGVAAYFNLRPSLLNSGQHKHHHKLTDFPEAPEGLSWIAGLIALFCYCCFLRDTWIRKQPSSLNIFVYSLLGPLLCGVVYLFMVYLHVLIPLNSKYTAALGISSICLGSFYLLACPAAAAHTSTIIILRNAGVHYLTFLIQLLGYFVWILDLLLGYQHPDWWGIAQILYLFSGNLIFVFISLMPPSSSEQKYSVLPLANLGSSSRLSRPQ